MIRLRLFLLYLHSSYLQYRHHTEHHHASQVAEDYGRRYQQYSRASLLTIALMMVISICSHPLCSPSTAALLKTHNSCFYTLSFMLVMLFFMFGQQAMTQFHFFRCGRPPNPQFYGPLMDLTRAQLKARIEHLELEKVCSQVAWKKRYPLRSRYFCGPAQGCNPRSTSLQETVNHKDSKTRHRQRL